MKTSDRIAALMATHLRSSYESKKRYCNKPGWSRIEKDLELLFDLLLALSKIKGGINVSGLCWCHARERKDSFVLNVYYYDKELDCLMSLYRKMEECRDDRVLSGKIDGWQKEVGAALTLRFAHIAKEIVDKIQEEA
jgi:hypothetical protein